MKKTKINSADELYELFCVIVRKPINWISYECVEFDWKNGRVYPDIDNASENKKATWDTINQNSTNPWSWMKISENPNITWDIVKQNPSKRWDLYYLTRNPNFNVDICIKHFSKQTGFQAALSQNINLTWDYVELYLNDWIWNWNILSSHPVISFEEVLDTLWKPWTFQNVNPHSNLFPELREDLHLISLTYGEFLHLV